jgi:ribosomal protein L11 methyltransferase
VDPVVLANLLRPLLLELADTLTSAPAHLIAAGLLTHEVDEVVGAFSSRLGLRERERRERGEWAAVWLSAT